MNGLTNGRLAPKYHHILPSCSYGQEWPAPSGNGFRDEWDLIRMDRRQETGLARVTIQLELFPMKIYQQAAGQIE